MGLLDPFGLGINHIRGIQSLYMTARKSLSTVMKINLEVSNVIIIERDGTYHFLSKRYVEIPLQPEFCNTIQ